MDNKVSQLLEESKLMNMCGAREYSPLALAYIGDAVYEVVIRTLVISIGNAPVNRYHQATKGFVQASAQARLYDYIKEIITSEEEEIFKRGRNAKSGSVAKNADIITYRHATGLETLIGYLYIDGKIERILELMKYGLNKVKEEQKNANKV